MDDQIRRCGVAYYLQASERVISRHAAFNHDQVLKKKPYFVQSCLETLVTHP